MPTSRTRVAILAIATAALALVALPAAPAVAASPSTGWVRVAHLSPDTKSVDVRLVALSGGSKVLRIDDVSYGAVSKYWTLPVGSYAVAMRPAGATEDSTPVVQTSVDVRSGGASTVAVFGANADLRTRIIRDTLSLPKAGNARVRVVQASTDSTPVTVTTNGGAAVVSDAATTTVSPYKTVRAGRWTLSASQGSDRTSTTIDLAAGQIASVFVLDDAEGGIVLRRVLDSASVGGVPAGYLATGGGYLAHEAQQQDDLLLVAAAGGLLLAGAAATGVTVRRRRARAHA
jgi:hypothetical protein